MAWRPTNNLIEGTVDNRVPGRVTGELRFLGRKRLVRLELTGDIAGEGRGKLLVLRNPDPQERNRVLPGRRPGTYMQGFAPVQRGETGVMKVDARGAYVEWYGDRNGRVVIELPRDQVELRDA